MSPAQQAEYCAKGKCFCCGGQYSPLHKCPAKSLAILLEADNVVDLGQGGEQVDPTQEEASEEKTFAPELQMLELSKLSSNGFDGAQTLKLFSYIGDCCLLTMIDNGASHCFISDQVAAHLRLPVDVAATFAVMLGDGTRVSSQGVCAAVPIRIAEHLFSITCYVFLLRSVDIILGVSLLTQLGDVTANWAKLTMEFVVDGKQIRLQGDQSLTRRACGGTGLYLLEVEDGAWVYWAMENSGTVSFPPSPSLSDSQQEELKRLVAEFPSVIETPTGLPLSRRSDHRIVLQDGVLPVFVRPYRYNHSQKDEMEKLVSEILAAGIIQPRCSPYSSPVLLVRKKDGSWRYCVDYRALNKVLVADKYHIPIIQELLDELHGARWFSKLDLHASYHEIHIAPKDIHKTAFRTHSGH